MRCRFGTTRQNNISAVDFPDYNKRQISSRFPLPIFPLPRCSLDPRCGQIGKMDIDNMTIGNGHDHMPIGQELALASDWLTSDSLASDSLASDWLTGDWLTGQRWAIRP